MKAVHCTRKEYCGDSKEDKMYCRCVHRRLQHELSLPTSVNLPSILAQFPDSIPAVTQMDHALGMSCPDLRTGIAKGSGKLLLNLSER